jgi:hypothetical protein
LANIRAALAELKLAWPAPMPPAVPVLEPAQMAVLISDIERNAARF